MHMTRLDHGAHARLRRLTPKKNQYGNRMSASPGGQRCDDLYTLVNQ